MKSNKYASPKFAARKPLRKPYRKLLPQDLVAQAAEALGRVPEFFSGKNPLP